MIYIGNNKKASLLLFGLSDKIIMGYVIAFSLFFSVSAFAEEDKIEYIDSYTYLRYSEEHAYLNEIWLWKRENHIFGVLFNSSKLQGDPFHFTAQKILATRQGLNNSFSFKTRFFSFDGSFSNLQIQGVLKSGHEVIWGGSQDSNVITLSKGSNIRTITNPKNTITSYGTWLIWANSLNDKY